VAKTKLKKPQQKTEENDSELNNFRKLMIFHPEKSLNDGGTTSDDNDP